MNPERLVLFEAGGSGFGFVREFTFEIGLYDQSCHRSSEIGTEAAMFDIDTDSNLRVFHRRKANEGGVILTRVLDGARLTADGIAGLDAGGGSMLYGEAHAFDNGRIGLGGNLRLTLCEIALVLRFFMDMRYLIPATVGDSDSEVAELQGRTGDITLSHTCPPDGLTIPAILIATVQVVGSCEESPLLALDIDVHRTA